MSVCPRTGRSPWRRKKNCLLFGICSIVLFMWVQFAHFNDGYQSLRPLGDAESEARRLLKFITHYHYQCNITFQVSNLSHWPICIDEAGLDIDNKDMKKVYTIGSRGSLQMEKALALNHTFQVFIVTSEKVPYVVHHTNNTAVVNTIIMPNDPADFARNSYEQQTMNNLMASLGHSHVDLLRLSNVVGSTNMWEVLHFMIYDNVLLNVDQLHVAMYIDKIDEDQLYNWYRTLYDLFYKQGFHLYHTTSSDSLCLQVTMMESCVYYLAFVRNPGPTAFVLHPPADFGTSELEEERLLSHISNLQVECKQRIIGGPVEEGLQFTTPGQPQWQVCSSSVYQLFEKPCKVFRFRVRNDHALEEKFIQEGCSVHTLEPALHTGEPIYSYKLHSHYPKGMQGYSRGGHQSLSIPAEKVFDILNNHGDISLMEIDVPGHEWEILHEILNSGVLKNVTQVVAEVRLPHDTYRKHPTVLRSRYSELRRLEAQNFAIFHSSPSQIWNMHQGTPNCCFQLGFVKRESRYR